jgi:hypothetical protein
MSWSGLVPVQSEEATSRYATGGIANGKEFDTVEERN